MKLFNAITATAVFALLAPVANATALHGCYEAQEGFAKSTSSTAIEQLGHYKIKLKSEEGSPKMLVLEGPFKGMFTDYSDPTAPVLDHVLSTYDRDGLIFTSDDQGQVVGQTPASPDPNPSMLEVVEVLNPVFGTGRFQGLIADSSNITVSGTIGLITGLNTFEVTTGQLCFG